MICVQLCSTKVHDYEGTRVHVHVQTYESTFKVQKCLYNYDLYSTCTAVRRYTQCTKVKQLILSSC